MMQVLCRNALAHLATDALGCSADRYWLVDCFAENAGAGYVDILAESGPQAITSVAKCASAGAL